MMKRQYTTPQIEVITLQSCGLLAGSKTVNNLGGNGGFSFPGGGTGGGRAPLREDFDEEDLAELLDFDG